MPFYARGTLRQWAQQQQPDHTALATVLQLVLEALAHLHAHRVFHLDLKPENILIDAAGRPHIADYDISHDGATRAVARRQTHMGVTRVGTDGFVAPELEAGAEASAAADLYSLGRTIEASPDELGDEGGTGEARALRRHWVRGHWRRPARKHGPRVLVWIQPFLRGSGEPVPSRTYRLEDV